MDIGIKPVSDEYMPVKQSAGASCFDCYAHLRTMDEVTIPRGGRLVVRLGFALELPQGYEAQIRPRSGMSKRGWDVCLGTIDSDYRGEVACTIVNNAVNDSDETGAIHIKAHQRVCQLYIGKSDDVSFKVKSTLSDTERGQNGFGSTGV